MTGSVIGLRTVETGDLIAVRHLSQYSGIGAVCYVDLNCVIGFVKELGP